MSDVECAIAMLWPEGQGEPVCEMFRVDRTRRRWESKHFSSGSSFSDGGRLLDGETARTLAESGTGSGLYRYQHAPAVTGVTFVVARLDQRLFDETSPRDWTLDRLKELPGANVKRFP